MTIGDYNCEGRHDFAGRFAGEWWVGVSTGSTDTQFVQKIGHFLQIRYFKPAILDDYRDS